MKAITLLRRILPVILLAALTLTAVSCSSSKSSKHGCPGGLYGY